MHCEIISVWIWIVSTHRRPLQQSVVVSCQSHSPLLCIPCCFVEMQPSSLLW